MSRSGALVVAVFLSSLLVLCRGQCSRENWVPAPIQTNPESLNGGTPLGFRLEDLPGDDSDNPDPCVRVFYDNPTSNNYVQVLVESSSTVCVRFLGGEEGTCNAPFCSTAVPLTTDTSNNRSYVDIRFFCTAACSSADSTFFYKVENASVAADVEDWCDTRNTTLPSSLRVVPPPTVVITVPTVFTGQPCTVWTPAPVQTDPASLTNPGGTPLGFRSLILPGAGSQNPTRCVRVFYDNTTNADYIYIPVEPEQSRICVRFVGAQEGDCGIGGVFFCRTAAIPLTMDPTTTRRYVDVELSCAIPCMFTNISIFYKVETASPDINDPSWCRTRNRALPSSLRSSPPPTSGTDPSSTANVTDGATTLTTLTSLSVLLITLAALLFH